MPDFLPRRDVDLLNWARAFADGVTREPAMGMLAATHVPTIVDAHRAFADAHRVANEPATRTVVSITAKDEARRSLVAQLRTLATVLRASPDVDRSTLMNVGLKPLRVGRSPRLPVPKDAPSVTVESVVGRRVTVRFEDATARYRIAKPRGVGKLIYFTFVGAEPPASLADWRYGRGSTRTRVTIDVPSSVPAGATLWIAGQWANPREQTGPISAAACTTVGGGLAMPRAA